MNLTKLSNAEYPLRDAREAIDGDNALNPADPTAYYTATGNPPGYWIGKGAELVGGKVGTTASSKTVRELINERRNPSNGQYLGDVKLVEGDNGEAPVAGFDLTTRQPKSISILWAFGDKETRDGIDECMRRATEMTIEYFEKEYATTRAGQGGVGAFALNETFVHVADIEQAGMLPGLLMFHKDALVLDGHEPAREGGHFGAVGLMPCGQRRGAAIFGHGGDLLDNLPVVPGRAAKKWTPPQGRYRLNNCCIHYLKS